MTTTSTPHNESAADVHTPAVGGIGHSDQFTTPRQTKSFLKLGLEVVLISVGVFLGLLGEQWRENAEHKALADDALRRFRTEFQASQQG